MDGLLTDAREVVEEFDSAACFAALLGTDEERDDYRRAVGRSHAHVHATADSPVGYDGVGFNALEVSGSALILVVSLGDQIAWCTGAIRTSA